MKYKKGKRLYESDLLKMNNQKVVVLQVEDGNIEMIHTVKLNFIDTDNNNRITNALVDYNGGHFEIYDDDKVMMVFEYIRN